VRVEEKSRHYEEAEPTISSEDEVDFQNRRGKNEKVNKGRIHRQAMERKRKVRFNTNREDCVKENC
jgi:hypothetical protein